MKIIVATTAATTSNMIRGAFKQAKAQNCEILEADSSETMAAAIAEDAVVLVDWDMDIALGTAFVKAAREASESVPILLLCPKQKAGTVFGGMQAGARGVVTKPFTAEELIKAVVNSLKQAQGKRPTVNVEFINPFIESTRNVFSTMCQIEASRKKLFLKDDYTMLGDVSGVMGLSGDASGSVVISLPAKLACVVVGRMLGEEPASELTADVCDGVGEVINMIAGQAKAALAETKYHFTISIPSVVSGQNHEITHKKGTPNIVVLFDAEGQDFAIQVCLAPNESTED